MQLCVVLLATLNIPDCAAFEDRSATLHEALAAVLAEGDADIAKALKPSLFGSRHPDADTVLLTYKPLTLRTLQYVLSLARKNWSGLATLLEARSVPELRTPSLLTSAATSDVEARRFAVGVLGCTVAGLPQLRL